MITQEHTILHSEEPTPPRVSPLKYQRLLRGWSQQELADALYEQGCARGHAEARVSADTVSRWERGIHQPSLFYCKLLCQLYSLDAAQLGLIAGQEMQG